MKKTSALKYSLFTLGMLFAMTLIADGQNAKKKYVEKNYKVNKTTKLQIKNTFGDVEINSWEKKEFSIKVEMIGKGRNEAASQRILEGIEIDITESSAEIVFETEISDLKKKNRGDRGRFEVNYTVYMPEGNLLEIKNSFGDVAMGNRDNDLDLDLSYGSMKVGDVKGNSKIKLSFGSGSIAQVKRGDMTVKYSDFEIDKANILDFTQSFSDIEIGEVAAIDIKSKYGKIAIEKAGKVDAEVHFSGFEIEELTESLELDCSYLNDFRIKKLTKTFTLIDIEGRFGSYEIGLESGLHADINAEFSFADLKYLSDVDVNFNYRVKEHNRNTYRGTIGKGNPDKRIQINSRYGNLRLTRS